ncbi:MAG: MarR family transcriptional regulator [Candidatus Solibacter usitatus]|nr:MarR family transcriptional regulator [Candidatus Solibacter usitatus]
MSARPEQDAFVALQRSAGVLMDELSLLLKQHGLSPPQYNVLLILRGARPEPLTCGEISARMVTRDSDITRLLDRMDRQGWISRSREQLDRRVVRVSITAPGLAMLKTLDAPVHALHRRQFSALGDFNTATLARLLDTLSAS